MTDPSNLPADLSDDREPTGNTVYSRRAFIGRTVTLGALVGLPGLLTACGGEDDAEVPGAETIDESPDASAASPDDILASECEGYDALTEQDLQTRETLGYVDNTPDPEKLCTNCQFYNQPEAGASCGGCQLFQGPVAPDGYCNSWVIAAGQAPADPGTT